MNYDTHTGNPPIQCQSFTVGIFPQCIHRNGYYRIIPKRFFGKQKVFVCMDCGNILDKQNKPISA